MSSNTQPIILLFIAVCTFYSPMNCCDSEMIMTQLLPTQAEIIFVCAQRQ